MVENGITIEAFYEYPTDTREKLLIALNFLNEKISEKNHEIIH